MASTGATAIAGAVNSPVPTPPTVDAGQLTNPIAESTKPRDSISIPLGGTGDFGPRSPDEILRQAIDPTGRFLPPPTFEQGLEIASTAIAAAEGTPSPEPPTLGQSLIPIAGNLMQADYYMRTDSPYWAAFYGAMAVTDVFSVKSLLQGGAKGLWKLFNKPASTPPNLTGLSAGLGEAADGAAKAAGALNNAGDAARGAEAAGTAGYLSAPIGRLADHHIFPRQFRDFFSARGINIDDFTVTLDHTITHLRGVHGAGNLGQYPGRWNLRWGEFIDNNPTATARDIFNFAGRLMDEFRLGHIPIHPYGG